MRRKVAVWDDEFVYSCEGYFTNEFVSIVHELVICEKRIEEDSTQS